MTTYTIHPLAVGFNETDQGILTYQRFYGKRIILPIYTFALMGGDLKILVDTGIEEFMAPQISRHDWDFPSSLSRNPWRASDGRLKMWIW